MAPASAGKDANHCCARPQLSTRHLSEAPRTLSASTQDLSPR